MNSFKDFLGDSRRNTADIAAHFLTEHPEHFNEVLDLTLADIPLISMRAARVVEITAGILPELGQGIINYIIPQLQGLKEIGALRSLLKMTIGLIPYVNEENDAILINNCFRWIEMADTPPAIYVYSLEILYGISNRIPELKPELVSILQHRKDEKSAGIKARSADILKRLNKEIL
jgi:hypothetical protein